MNRENVISESWNPQNTTIEELESFKLEERLKGDVAASKIAKVCSQVQIPKEILLWSLVNSQFCDEGESVQKALRTYMSKSYVDSFENARLAMWRACLSTDYSQVLAVSKIFNKYRTAKLRPDDLTDCNNAQEMQAKINLYSLLSKKKLKEFYLKTVPLFDIGQYHVSAGAGFYEHMGGFILIMSDEKPFVHVGGRLHNKQTKVLAIHGEKDYSVERFVKFKEQFGIHPANLTLLLYLHLGRLLENNVTLIRGSASRAFNMKDINSDLYSIPKFYFRVDVNPETGYYELDVAKRNSITEKFVAKSEVVKNAFSSLEQYLLNKS